MNPEERLAGIIAALDSLGLSCIVMGGHAVRYYGLQRHTNDFDLTVASDEWDLLTERLGRTGLFVGLVPVEGNSWRPNAFRRFLIGNLPNGQEEWLEFWRGNHLLAPFPELWARRELGDYGGRSLPFLSLPDLIRSKETERAKDWDDIVYLEEFLDARLHSRLSAGTVSLAEALAQNRSRRGFDTYLGENKFAETAAIRSALEHTTNPVTQSFLLPWTPDAVATSPVIAMEPLVEKKLRSVTPASPLHRSLVEA